MEITIAHEVAHGAQDATGRRDGYASRAAAELAADLRAVAEALRRQRLPRPGDV